MILKSVVLFYISGVFWFAFLYPSFCIVLIHFLNERNYIKLEDKLIILVFEVKNKNIFNIWIPNLCKRKKWYSSMTECNMTGINENYSISLHQNFTVSQILFFFLTKQYRFTVLASRFYYWGALFQTSLNTLNRVTGFQSYGPMTA